VARSASLRPAPHGLCARHGPVVSNRRKVRPANPPRRTLPVDQAYWNGLPTTAARGTAVVTDDGTFPEYWARTEGIVGERIPVVRVDLDGVNYGGGVAHLDDRDGSGWRKVTEGHGGPGWPSRSVAIEPGSFQ
jgi:hypothetical protein